MGRWCLLSLIPAHNSQLGGWVCIMQHLEKMAALTHWCWNKMVVILQKTFWNAFSWMKSLNQISLKFVPKGQTDNKSALLQVMAWVPKGHQTIIWNNDDTAHWHTYVSSNLNELSVYHCNKKCWHNDISCTTYSWVKNKYIRKGKSKAILQSIQRWFYIVA